MKFEAFDQMYGSDPDKAEQGVWFPMGTNDDNSQIEFLIRQANTKLHKKIRRKYEKALENNRHNREKTQKIQARIVAEALLADWKNVKTSKGEVVEATLENKIEALLKYESLFIDVVTIAGDNLNFRSDPDADDPEEDTEKNLEGLPDGGEPIQP